MNYVVIFAGGVGTRMGSDIPKQFLEVDNKPILVHTVEKFSNNDLIDGIVVVCKKEYLDFCNLKINSFGLKKIIDVIPGGETGQDSIYQGLDYLAQNVSNCDDDIVLIHDGVRPVIDNELIDNSIACVMKNGNSIAVSKAIETVIKVDENGCIAETVNRAFCRNAKAPQCFYLKDIYEVHNRARKVGYNDLMIDSASLMSFYGYKLNTIECSCENIKITTINDFCMFKTLYEMKNNNNN